jgi:transcriptional regulator with XRE-family HTH domain
MKKKLKEGKTLSDLAAEYKVAYQTVSSIKNGRNWPWVK